LQKKCASETKSAHGLEKIKSATKGGQRGGGGGGGGGGVGKGEKRKKPFGGRSSFMHGEKDIRVSEVGTAGRKKGDSAKCLMAIQKGGKKKEEPGKKRKNKKKTKDSLPGRVDARAMTSVDGRDLQLWVEHRKSGKKENTKLGGGGG